PGADRTASVHRNSIAILVGNEHYEHTTEVRFAHNDVRAMRDYLVSTLGFRVENVHVHTDLRREGMESVFGNPKRGDGELMALLGERRLDMRGDVFVFYSGHGAPDPEAVNDAERRAFLLPIDVRQERIGAAAFPFEQLQATLELVRAQ